MIFGPVRSWHSKAAFLKLAFRFAQVFGFFWLILEPMALWRPEDLRWGLRGYLGLVFISLLIALFWAWPKVSITRKLSISDTKITITVGDVLNQKGNIVIGCNDVFDTELVEIISPESIQGQFQKQVFPQQSKLDEAIKAALSGVRCVVDQEKLKGKNERYPVGTIARLEANGNRYFLVAYSRMLNELRTESDICKLSQSLNDCWKAVRTYGQREPIHMGIVGSGHARIGLPRALLLQFIVLSFMDAERKESLSSHLTVYIHENDIEHVDFVDLESWLAGLTRAA